MMKINNEAKFSLAKECTLLAIQNNLINKWENPESTAKEVTTFFKTVFETLDSDATE